MSVLTPRRATRTPDTARGRHHPAGSVANDPSRPLNVRTGAAAETVRVLVDGLLAPLPYLHARITPEADAVDDEESLGGRSVDAARADTGADTGARAAASAEWPERTRRLQGSDQARIICFANQSGGSGKTTSATSMGYLLSELGFKVLVIDLDPQHDSCHIFGYTNPDQICGICLDSYRAQDTVTRRGIERVPMEDCVSGHKPEPHPNMFDVLINGTAEIRDAVRPALVQASQPVPGLDIALASLDLSAADKNFAQIMGAELQLSTALEATRLAYDYILIDSPASLGTLMVNILVASDYVIACIKAGQKELRAVEELLRTIATVNLHLRKSRPLELGGVLVTSLPSKRDGVIYQAWADQVPLIYPGLDLPPVPRTAMVAQSYTNRVVLPIWAPRHAASKAYSSIIDTLLPRKVL